MAKQTSIAELRSAVLQARRVRDATDAAFEKAEAKYETVEKTLRPLAAKALAAADAHDQAVRALEKAERQQ